MGSNPDGAEETNFMHHSFGLSRDINSVGDSNLACALIPQMGGWILRNCWLIISSSVVLNEMRACKLEEKNWKIV